MFDNKYSRFSWEGVCTYIYTLQIFTVGLQVEKSTYWLSMRSIYSIMRKLDLPFSQLGPLNPRSHKHWYWLISLTHVPPFWHGKAAHSSKPAEKKQEIKDLRDIWGLCYHMNSITMSRAMSGWTRSRDNFRFFRLVPVAIPLILNDFTLIPSLVIGWEGSHNQVALPKGWCQMDPPLLLSNQNSDNQDLQAMSRELRPKANEWGH